jgi:hypothetical protein
MGTAERRRITQAAGDRIAKTNKGVLFSGRAEARQLVGKSIDGNVRLSPRHNHATKSCKGPKNALSLINILFS